MKVSFLFIFIFPDLSECFPAYPLVAAGSSIISLVRDIISKQKAPALAAPTFGLTPAFSEWKPKIMGGEEVYAQKAPFLLKAIFENMESLQKTVNKISSEVNRSDDIGKK